MKKDDLQEHSNKWNGPEVETVDEEDDLDDEASACTKTDDNDGVPLDVMMDFANDLEQPLPENDNDPKALPAVLQGFSFTKFRNKGEQNCGFELNVDVESDPTVNSEPMHRDVSARSNNNTGDSTGNFQGHRPRHTQRQLVEIAFRRTTRRRREGVFKNKEARVGDATGSYRSIKEWADAAQLDKLQRRAFESILAAFLLTFYEEAEVEDESQQQQNQFEMKKEVLLRLRGTKNTLVMLQIGRAHV